MFNWTIGTKIGASFFTLALILVGSIVISIFEVSNTAAITTRAIELRAPTAQASVSLMNGVNHSLAALRGWIILGNDKFKQERQESWDNINQYLADLDKYSKSWTNPENVRKLGEMKRFFKDFEGYQKEIENIANTPQNNPANYLLLNEAAPQANILVDRITKIINIEMTLPANARRKAVLGMMADVRGTTARSLANIRAFLLSGNDVFKERFNVMWTKNIKRFGDLTRNRRLLNAQQKRYFDEFSAARKIFAPLPEKMFVIRGSKEWNLANTWLGTKAAPTAGKIMGLLNGMVANQAALLKDDSKLATETTDTLLTVQWVLLAVGVLFSLFLGFVVTRNISKLISALKETIHGLIGASYQLTDASGQVAKSSQSLAEGSSEQAASLEETSSTLEEMSSMTMQNAENTKQADILAGESREKAKVGGEAMSRMSSAISDIKDSSDQTAKIIKTIDEIAFQTNLLALNAAVEAARAGDAGKGFAVVAEEVRNLARRAAEAAQSTNALIENSKEKSEIGVNVATEAGAILAQINEATGKVGDLMKEISLASDEQAKGAAQVNMAVTQMDELTQSNAANAEETAASSQQLSAQAIQVREAVEKLQELVGGGTSKTPASAQLEAPSRQAFAASPQAPSVSLKDRILSDQNVEPGMTNSRKDMTGFQDSDFKDM